MRRMVAASLGCLLVALGGACGDGADATPTTTAAASGSGGAGGEPIPNPDGDCLSDEEEAELGTDPALVDSDADGKTDCEEVACVSNPIDAAEVCYACGWPHGDPGTLQSTGAAEGDVIGDLDFVDQCGEEVSLWDFAGAYRIMFMTESW